MRLLYALGLLALAPVLAVLVLGLCIVAGLGVLLGTHEVVTEGRTLKIRQIP